jgi:hypothetical protein
MALAALLLLTVGVAGAQPTDPYPIGEITMHSTQVAAGLGWTWGGGTLKFKGKTYQFDIKGLNVAAVGVSKFNARGDVYNLKNPSDLAGKYLAASAGAAVIKGKAGLIMRNEKGVVINLKSDQEGVQLNLGADGLVISMK